MKITSKSRIAIKSLIVLGLESKRLSVREIAEVEDLSVRYLEQVISSLKKSHLVDSLKGANGGYALAKSADQITVFDIVTAIEGNQGFSEEATSTMEKVLDDFVFSPLDYHLEEKLKSVKLIELIEEFRSKTNSEYMYYI